MTKREDLKGQTPREFLLAKKDFIDFDLDSRQLQWSLIGQCPPPLPYAAHAYRFAGFGIHENVIYYDLIRFLLVDEDCHTCRAMAEFATPMFWHLDGCNMDDRFEFSFFRTREEWEADRRSWEEFNRQFDQEWKERERKGFDGDPIPSEDHDDWVQ